MFQRSYREERSKGFQVRLKGVSSIFKGVSRVLKEVQKVCQGSFNCVSRVFQNHFLECFKEVLEVFRDSFKGVSRKI